MSITQHNKPRRSSSFFSAAEISCGFLERLRAVVRVRPEISVEACVLIACIGFVLFYNVPFWRALLGGRSLSDATTWLLASCLFIAIALVHFVALSVVCNRWTTKPILAALFTVNAFAAPFMLSYGVHLDQTMIRNIVRTDVAEAAEYLGVALVASVIVIAAIPLLLLSRVRLRRLPLGRAVSRRVVFTTLALLAAVGVLLPVMQDFAPLMRTEPHLRYLITPGNYLYSSAKEFARRVQSPAEGRTHFVARDLHAAGTSRDHKPVLFVLVIGETARGDNFSLNGYSRITNPRLSKLSLVNFKEVASCGTATEVSLPCMLSARGRAGYSDDIAEREDGLIQVLAHSGYRVRWYDNNSGCKGTCDGDGIEVRAATSEAKDLCVNGRCLDEVLLRALRNIDELGSRNTFIVLHQLGNHGPAYYQRYPQSFKRFVPTCDTAELRACTAEQITNTYDNAILYTDYILAEVIAWLQSRSDDFNAAMLYVADHGESLGERGLYLHGLPYAIAPHVQTHVPMLMWMSDAFRSDFDVDTDCLRLQAEQELSHDNLFHSVLGLLSVETPKYEPSRDVLSKCSRSGAAISKAMLTKAGAF